MAKAIARMPNRLLSVRELADLLQVPVRTLYQWKLRGDGPQPMRVGRYLRYDPADVAHWLDVRKAAS
jgi:predicted DNA-binding transcriptional regulator AlpA